MLLLTCLGLVWGPTSSAHAARAQAQVPQGPASADVSHTAQTVDYNCHPVYFSPDGNPFPICPGPFPVGGNCTWWAWDQWHQLGYDLPLNWGNAADWFVDAERTGLPVGVTPRVGSIAVFPRGDGVWAFGPEGHVAFVTSVGADGGAFNVTYQNYGDPSPIHVGIGYSVTQINAPGFQNGALHFIYFPKTIDATRFSHLAGINGSDLTGVALANSSLGIGTANESRLTLGLPPQSSDQEFNADFTGTGLSDLLLYNRQQGRIEVLNLSSMTRTPNYSAATRFAVTGPPDGPAELPSPQLVSLSDKTTAVDGWGSSLDIHVGDFSGSGHSEILLYDRVSGKLQIISLTPQLTIQKHAILPGWGPGWEFYSGRFDGKRTGVFLYNRFALATTKPPVTNTSQGASALDLWRPWGRTANVVLLNFKPDLSLDQLQEYNHWHNSWEVYVGPYVSTHQDAVLLYDRSVGEARTISFDNTLQINDYNELHGLIGNWEVHSGDFNGSGRAQVLLYDPSQGNGKFLVLAPDLSLAKEKSYSGWKVNMVFYVGHFGTSTLNAMLYDPQMAQSTFIVFDSALNITHLYTVHSWDRHWQILVGAFLDRSRCLPSGGSGNCTTGDDILVLNRRTGEIQQFVFSFGRQYQIADSRASAFVREGVVSGGHLWPVDSSSYNILGTLTSDIRDEELY